MRAARGTPGELHAGRGSRLLTAHRSYYWPQSIGYLRPLLPGCLCTLQAESGSPSGPSLEQRYFAERLRQLQSRPAEVPRELLELSARIERLRERLRQGGPDIAADVLEAAIEREQEKARALEAAQPAVRQSAKVRAMLPDSAELYRRQIAAGLDGDAREPRSRRGCPAGVVHREDPPRAPTGRRAHGALEPERGGAAALGWNSW